MKIEREEMNIITTLRHEMHICDSYSEWYEMYYLVLDSCNKLELTINLDGVKSPEDISCDNDDCGFENGDCECDLCDIAEAEYLSDMKEKINSQIENFLVECEETLGFEELAPSGYARACWIENNMR